ncbi:MAG: baseplate J/gp47 family protein, partial [Bacteroidia bacterium]
SNRGNDPAHLNAALAASSVKGMLNDDDGLRSAVQPYASFGGHPEETAESFRIRVSERLRHKQRAITIWDYEHLVLEAFPSVFRAKAINHTHMETATNLSPAIYSETAPGHAGIVLVADLRNKNAVNPLRPRLPLLTLEKVKAFLQAIMPPLAKVHVRNPYFEEIQLSFDVKFKPGFDISFYSKQLQTDIRNYLAPWLSGKAEISFGGRIHKSAVIDMIDELPYVDYVTCFKMNQLRSDLALPNLTDIETAEPTRAASVLTSAVLHAVTVLETETCDCPDNDVKNPFPQPGTEMGTCGNDQEDLSDGISFDIINNDFIVGHSGGEGVGYWTIEDNFNVQ